MSAPECDRTGSGARERGDHPSTVSATKVRSYFHAGKCHGVQDLARSAERLLVVQASIWVVQEQVADLSKGELHHE
jgi:hypothetical protein